MFNMENIGKKHDRENIILELMGAVQSMTTCENDVNEVTEKIIKSCNTEGTKGADHKSLLMARIEGLNRLAGLYRSASEKYESAAEKVAGGVPEEKVLADLLPYNVSLNDQMNAEKKCYEKVLSMLSA
jgi:hypothetical protein